MGTLPSTESAARLRALPYYYEEVGATASALPPGYFHLGESNVVSVEAFEAAAERLMTWRVHEAAGLRVTASSPRVQTGDVVDMFLGPRFLQIRVICRVVAVIDEPHRVGFIYGTLEGHAESGEESFVIERIDGTARFTIRALSRPASLLARCGGPASRAVQTRVTRRHLRAINARS